ncbi:carbohydrate ABC transporter permease [Cellulomonas fimi]|uniref:Binding-protein-dependent transport systems inner membrane component n=1 Tax=Cellulomonas fimi (strain ATCC 484 / DSM 20113 / JCM 1341 / CCUG 24087 / LMG 16345 / NBRC 15513 / NCIMB 8980 / NCTC 7547 / NRS-133) TaxID=590998 RepID=F4GYI1_CELFA|nr:carbohydrate ABC transporter permease [Cellulomonas fimi]AEE47098.1 binding-protein-dependent transport systems inner membrane component [Cellulomonas fimi ATCC 484]NNH07331.1 carbohydrate ABC transporter permease [Cellulomonas fimi]VEH35240.1 Inner membrane ABC transporter permease protein ycjP [Cellulomonas fimi]
MSTLTVPHSRADLRTPSPTGKRRRRPVRATVQKVLTTAITVVVLAVVVVPLIWLFLGSLKTQAEFLDNPAFALPENWLNFENYSRAITEGNLGQYARNSVLAVFPSLFLTLLFGVAAGFALEVMVWKGRSTVLLLFLAGIMVPGQMILLPLFTMYFRAGLTGSLWPLVITYTAIGLPLTTFMMATFFRSVPRELFEAATLDGASVIRMFFSIGIPLVSNALFTVALVQFFFIWNDLLIAMTFTNSDELRTIQVGLLNFRGQFGQIEYGPTLAAVCLNVLGTLLIYLFLNQRVMKGLTAGSVKG